MSHNEKPLDLLCASTLGTDVPSFVGAAVLMDEWHHRTMNTLPLLEGAHIHESLPELNAAEDRPNVVAILDTRPEMWLKAINRSFESGTDDREVFIITTQDHTSVIEAMAGGGLVHALEVHVIAVWHQLSVTGLRVRGEESRALQPLVVGLRAGREPLLRDQEARLLAAAVHATEVREVVGTHEDRLTARITELEGELELLQSRYHNLLNSTLGRVTTRYWAFRKRWRS